MYSAVYKGKGFVVKKLWIFVFGFIFTVGAFATGIDSGATSADCDNATLGQYNGTANLEMDWQPNTINIRWYDGENQLSVQSAAQTCSYGGALYLPTAPTKKGYTFEGWEVKYAIPEEYTELQYIEGGRYYGAYMDLGFPATPTMQTLLVASLGQMINEQQVIFGAADNNDFNVGKPYVIDISLQNVLIPNGDYNSTTSRVKVALQQDVIYQFKVNYPNVGQIGINDTIKTGFTNLSFVPSNNLYLFTAKYPYHTSSFPPQKMKVYKLTFWNNGATVHNFIPVKRNSDNTVGLWDSVSKTFNSGTGGFVAGPVVQ